MNWRTRLSRLESVLSKNGQCRCRIGIVELGAGEVSPPLPRCPWCDAQGLIRGVEVVQPALAQEVSP